MWYDKLVQVIKHHIDLSEITWTGFETNSWGRMIHLNFLLNIYILRKSFWNI